MTLPIGRANKVAFLLQQIVCMEQIILLNP